MKLEKRFGSTVKGGIPSYGLELVEYFSIDFDPDPTWQKIWPMLN